MQKLTLTKNSTQIELEMHDDGRVVLHYTFKEDEQNNLDDYMYLIDKISQYLKSGEYEVKIEKENP